jgi:muramoyltetrapeptide carboxypeptidase
MLDAPEIKAILCGRGGYGMSRIIDSLDFTRFRKNPKWIIGFSDITVLHTHLLQQHKIASIHGPMAAAFAQGGNKSKYVQSLRHVLAGQPIQYKCKPHRYNKTGQAEGILVGGNLALLAHVCGTPSEPDTKKRILFIEDVGEYLYNIDRMMLQLKRAGKLRQLAGLIVGGFTDVKDTTRPFGKTAYQIIQEHVAGYTYPVCFGFPVSHARENYALPCGTHCTLSVTETGVYLTQPS